MYGSVFFKSLSRTSSSRNFHAMTANSCLCSSPLVALNFVILYYMHGTPRLSSLASTIFTLSCLITNRVGPKFPLLVAFSSANGLWSWLAFHIKQTHQSLISLQILALFVLHFPLICCSLPQISSS